MDKKVLLVSNEKPSGDIGTFIGKHGYRRYYGPITPGEVTPALLERLPPEEVDIFWMKSPDVEGPTRLEEYKNATYGGRKMWIVEPASIESKDLQRLVEYAIQVAKGKPRSWELEEATFKLLGYIPELSIASIKQLLDATPSEGPMHEIMGSYTVRLLNFLDDEDLKAAWEGRFDAIKNKDIVALLKRILGKDYYKGADILLRNVVLAEIIRKDRHALLKRLEVTEESIYDRSDVHLVPIFIARAMRGSHDKEKPSESLRYFIEELSSSGWGRELLQQYAREDETFARFLLSVSAGV